MCILCRGLGPRPLDRRLCDVSGDSTIAPEQSTETVTLENFVDNLPGGQPALREVDELPASTATTSALRLGQSAYGRVGSAGDQDWYRIDVTAGQTYELRLHGFGRQGVQLNDPLVRLLNSSGVEVATNNDTGSAAWDGANGLDSRLVFTASTTGPMYVSAQAFGTLTGDYLLTYVRSDSAGMVYTSDEIAWQLLDNFAAYFYSGGNASSGVAARWNVGADNALSVNIAGLSAAEQNLARNALATWSMVTGIRFVETGGTAEITFRNTDAATTAYCSTSFDGSSFITSATVMISTGWVNAYGSTLSSYTYETYVHEIGHALGLGHGGNYNGSASYPSDAGYRNDSLQYSVMSYFDTNNTYVNASSSYRTLGPQIADIVAVRHLYGLIGSPLSGDTIYGFGSNTGIAAIDQFVNLRSGGSSYAMLTVFDTGGTDTIDFSNHSGGQRIDLRAEAFSNVLGGTYNLAIARDVVIENARGGGGEDRIFGNDAGNVLSGNGGNDQLIGFGGNDVLIGGPGNDSLDGGLGNDGAVFSGARASFALRSFESGGRFFTELNGLGGGDGTDLLVDVEALGFQGSAVILGLAGIQQNRVANIDGDRFDDVLFQNQATGGIFYQDMFVGQGQGFQEVLSAQGEWRLFGSGDVTGEGRAEVLVQSNATRAIAAISTATGTPVITAITGSLGASWQAVASGDVTRDGTIDVLMRNMDSGYMMVGDVDAGGALASWITLPHVGLDWRLVGMGDFNRDGASDVLLQSSTDGSCYYRDVVNGKWGTAAGAIGPQWTAREAADINGDGFCDVVMRNTATNDIIFIDMLGGSPFAFRTVANGIAGWELKGSADVDNDGYSDIVIQNATNGNVWYADMNANSFTGWGVIAGTIGMQWNPVV